VETLAAACGDSFCGTTFLGGDFNGDGKTDIYCSGQTSAPVAYAGTADKQADLLLSLTNGMGGSTTVSYVSSKSFVNINNRPSKYAVQDLTVADGRGWTSTTRYSYAGGLMDRKERRFLGFRTMKTFSPCLPNEADCPVSESTFKQDHIAHAGMPEKVEQKDTDGRVLSAQVFEYTVSGGGTLPWKSHRTGTWSYTYDGTTSGCANWPCATGKRSYATTQYDAYGNVTQASSYGDYDYAGDETTAATTFVPNTTAYIVGKPALAQTFAGIGTGGAKLQEARVYYDGAVTWNVQPSQGYPTQTDQWLKSETEDRYVSSSTAYDTWGNPTSVTDPTGRRDTTDHLFPEDVCNAANECTHTDWLEICSAPEGVTDVNNQTSTTSYDDLCRPTTTSLPLGGFQIRSYPSLGDPNLQKTRVETASATDDGINDFTETYFDGLGRTYRTAKKGPSPSQTIYADTTYNARGGVATQTDAYYNGDTPRTVSHQYDTWNRLVRTVLPDGYDRETSYGLWRQTTTDENGKQATSRRVLTNPFQSQQERYLNGQPVITTSTSDLLGRLVQMTDHLGHEWTWTFDSLGRNTQKVDPDAGTWSFVYDDAGRLTSQTDAKNQTTTLVYDTLGRLQTKTTIDERVTTVYSEPRTGFFNKGRPTTITNTALPSETVISTLQMDYDALGRLVKQARGLDGQSYVMQRTYCNVSGYLLGMTWPDGDTTGSGNPALCTTGSPLLYDAAGRLKAVPGIITSVTYDASGRPLVQSNANGTTTTRTYSPNRGFLTNILTVGGTTIQDLTYTVDPVGMVSDVTSPFVNESWNYQYDDLYRLTTATNTTTPAESQSWTYDEIGRITYNSRVGNYTYPSVGQPRPHAPTAAGALTFTSYDANGNLVTGANRTMVWDANNRITSATLNGTTASFTYGAGGERLTKAVGASTTKYPLGDDYEIAPDGTITKYFSAYGVPIAKRVGAGVGAQTYWLHTDRLGSVSVITDGAGAEVWREKYRPYGETLGQGGSQTESRGWIGQRNDSETGLTYLHARYYDPTLGLFLSPDPIRAQFNTYGYGPGDPVNGADPTGLEWCFGWGRISWCDSVTVYGSVDSAGGGSAGGGSGGNSGGGTGGGSGGSGCEGLGKVCGGGGGGGGDGDDDDDVDDDDDNDPNTPEGPTCPGAGCPEVIPPRNARRSQRYLSRRLLQRSHDNCLGVRRQGIGAPFRMPSRTRGDGWLFQIVAIC
jgi:RHS repeat-associated protein